MADPSELIRRFNLLLKGHTSIYEAESARLTNVVKGILPRFLKVRNEWAEAQRKTAEDFNLLEIMGLDCNEVCHSRLLAWLLDRRIEIGTHAQGNLGFRLFLEEIAGELQTSSRKCVLAYADEPEYWVRREYSGDESRIDLEIAARGQFLIHVENKIHASEAGEATDQAQTDREARDLETRRIELAVPKSNCHGIFLTLNWGKATNNRFRSIGWVRIANVLERFALEAEPAEVTVFARHYARAVRKLGVLDRAEVEAENADL
ncbi:MAG: PD-(D/E)XK nuclease family protein [Planctomycetia bacterium]|nr:PD-(D/E)XK nuclease family protein [Planctomycetia bacterium]